MPVASSDLLLYGSANIPTDDTSTAGGAIDTGNELQGTTIGELFDSTPANAAGGSDIIHYQKCFYKNTNASDDLSDAVIWLLNGLASFGTAGSVSAVSTSSSDDSTKYIKVFGFDSGGNALTESITLNGTSSVNGSSTFASIWKVELRLVATDALTTADGDITITRGSDLGMIPTGYYSATAEIEIGLESSLDDSNTTTNRLTAPSGITFSKAIDEGTALDVANSGVLSSGSAQGIWLKRTIKAGLTATTDIEIILRIKGTA